MHATYAHEVHHTSKRQSDKLQDAISLCSSEHGAVYKSFKILLNLFTDDFRDFFIYRCFSSHHDVLPDFSEVHAPVDSCSSSLIPEDDGASP